MKSPNQWNHPQTTEKEDVDTQGRSGGQCRKRRRFKCTSAVWMITKGRNLPIPVSMLEMVMSSYQYEAWNLMRMYSLELSAPLPLPQDWQPRLGNAACCLLRWSLPTWKPGILQGDISLFPPTLWMTWSSCFTWKPSITDFWLYISYVNVWWLSFVRHSLPCFWCQPITIHKSNPI